MLGLCRDISETVPVESKDSVGTVWTQCGDITGQCEASVGTVLSQRRDRAEIVG